MQTQLGVNVDHVATVREARKIDEPDPVKAASVCEQAGCHLITAHLREDRRHVNDQDVYNLKNIIQTKFNLEMSCASEIVNIALDLSPHQVTLVPEKREEVTTEGGLDIVAEENKIRDIILEFKKNNISVSLFIDPEKEQIESASKIGADFIEIHTGAYANAKDEVTIKRELERVENAAKFASGLGLRVNAGHGLNYNNVNAIAKIDFIEELNIGHSIISYSIFVGLEQAVQEMLELIKK